MTRGFVTIATGDIRYYKMAYNLWLSYHYHTTHPLPFAIIAEEENQYTQPFDKVIITHEAEHTFMDKFLLLKLFPWDESIFFDADSLAFGDLNDYWTVFEGTTDFSAVGINVGLHDAGAWYNVEDIAQYGPRLTYKVRVHMGVCFIRHTSVIEKLLADCKDIWNNYDKLFIHTNPTCYDEVILGIAMPLNNMKTCQEPPNFLAVYPCLDTVSGDMKNGVLSYKTRWGTEVKRTGKLLHFGNANTKTALYRYSANWLEFNDKQFDNAFVKATAFIRLQVLRTTFYLYDVWRYVVQFYYRCIKYAKKHIFYVI